MLSPITHPRLWLGDRAVAYPSTSTRVKWMADVHCPPIYFLTIQWQPGRTGTKQVCAWRGMLKEEKLESIRECPYYHISKWYLVSFANKQTLQEQLAGTLSFLWRWFIVRSIDISWAPVMCKASCFELFKIQRELYTRCRSGFHKICRPTSKTKI